MTTAQLTIAPFLQRYDAATGRLTVHVTLAPVGDPRLPLTDGFGAAVPPGPAFAGANLVLRPHAAGDPSVLPTLADVAAGDEEATLAAPPQQGALFAALAARYQLTRPPAMPARDPGLMLRKYLPTSYRAAFPFVSPRTQLAVTDDAYHCARECPPSTPPVVTPPVDGLSWGEAFAALMRQPVTARGAGLIHTVEVDATPFVGGGFLFFTLAPSGDFAAQHAAAADFVEIYATRVPKLAPGQDRAVFTPVLFPVAAHAAAAAALGSFDDAFAEALRFDDGFARIVHCGQPHTVDPNAAPDASGSPPVTDVGLQLGWDDEDVVVALNRALCPAEPGKPGLAPAPPGFSGWRVDARPLGAPAWSSLCRVRGDGNLLDTALGAFEEELAVEIQPSRLGEGMWLRPYHTRWRARSLVAPTVAETVLAGRPAPAPAPYKPIGLDEVALRYGQSYEFRVRMRDVTGGGPAPDAAPVHAGEAGTATWRMRRYVPLGALRVTADAPDETGLPTGFTLHRPRLGWPAAVYTGLPGAQEELEALVASAGEPGATVDISLPDPDAELVALTVLVRQPRFDDLGIDDGYAELYTAYRAFPSLAGLTDAPVMVPLAWVDAARLDESVTSPSTQEAPGTGPLLLPTGRDVRLVARAVGRDDLGYFGAESTRWGQRRELLDGVVRTPTTEPPILVEVAVDGCVSVFLRPDGPATAADAAGAPPADPTGVYPRRFAAAAGLVESGGSLLAEAGTRAVFGVFGLAHAMAPDNGSARLAATADLPGKWLTVLRLRVERDWTWLAPHEPAFTVHRTLVNRTTGADLDTRREIGSIPFPHVINRQCAVGPQDRDNSLVVVVDAFAPMLGADGLPHEIEARYEVTAHGYPGSDEPVTIITRLPVTTPPADVPTIVSAGHAFSDYEILGDYAETADRRRMLWLEFAEPPRDPRDRYFARVLTHAPDPMLLPGSEPLADPPGYEGLIIDPELVRVVRPGQGEDFSGLAAMQPLIPARTEPGERAVHYLVPLPASLTPEAPELFGFFTYEIRAGHARSTPGGPFWSTATGRFGPGVVLEGVQHPPPILSCEVVRSTDGVDVSSELAVAISGGRLVSTLPPPTELWFVAYARVTQADGATKRNIQIGLRRGGVGEPPVPARSTRLGAGAGWSDNELRTALAVWALPPDTPLGFVAVEVLPEPNGTFTDPVGGDLGQVRILRTSRLVDAGAPCC